MTTETKYEPTLDQLQGQLAYAIAEGKEVEEASLRREIRLLEDYPLLRTPLTEAEIADYREMTEDAPDGCEFGQEDITRLLATVDDARSFAAEVAALAIHRWKHPTLDLSKCPCRADAEWAVAEVTKP